MSRNGIKQKNVMMAYLYQASREHNIHAAGDDGLPIPGLKRADYLAEGYDGLPILSLTRADYPYRRV